MMMGIGEDIWDVIQVERYSCGVCGRGVGANSVLS